MRFSAEINSVEILTSQSPAAFLTGETSSAVYVARSGYWTVSYLQETIGSSSPPQIVSLSPGEFVAFIAAPPQRIRVSVVPSDDRIPKGETAVCLWGILKLDPAPATENGLPPVIQGSVSESGLPLDRVRDTRGDADQVEEFAVLLRSLIHALPQMSENFSSVKRDSGVSKAIAAMELDLGRSWTLSQLADEAEISRSSLAQKFKEQTGTTPSDHLLNLRMKRAETLMKDERQQLKVIARLVGYRSVSAFSTAYKRWSGKPPSHDRRSSS